MNSLNKLGLALAAVVVLCAASPVFAQPTPAANAPAAARSAAPFYGVSIGAGIGAGLVIIGAGIGFGRIGGSALESMARQPETAARVQTAMIIIGALLEGVTLFALVVCIIVSLKDGI